MDRRPAGGEHRERPDPLSATSGAEVMVGGLDFGALPPEVNSGLMYAGVGSGPMTAAATTLSELANELDTAAGAITSILSGLTSSTWQGPAATAMAAAAAPYTAWMRTTASHTAHAAGRAAAAAAAYQTAFAAMVPPSVIAANRAQHAALVATNQLGQNTAAIAAADAAYSTMWAQDVAAMYNYANESAAATALNPLTTAPAITTPASATNQTAAATHATAATAANTQTSLSQLISTLPTLDASQPGDSLNIFSPAASSPTSGLSGLLNAIGGQSNSSLADFLNSGFVSGAFSNGIINPESAIQVFHAFDYLPIYAAADHVQSVLGSTGGVDSITTQLAAAHTPAPAAATHQLQPGTPAGTYAGVGKATLVGALSAPPNWTTTASAASPVAGTHVATRSASALPVFTAGIPSTAVPGRVAASMVDKAEDDEEQTPVYGSPTKALTRTPAGG